MAAGRRAKLVGEAADCDARDPATGLITLQKGEETQVPLRLEDDFDGDEIEVRATTAAAPGVVLGRKQLKNQHDDVGVNRRHMDALDQKLVAVFAGKVVRKDLLQQIKGGENVPSYVLEYLLGGTARRTTRPRFRPASRPSRTRSTHYFRQDESNKAQSLVERNGRHRFIDRVEVRFVPSEAKYWASMDNFGYSRIHIPDEFHRRYERLLEGGIWALVDLEFHAPEETGKGASPFHVVDLKPIQLARFDFEDFCEGRRAFTTEEWIDALTRSVGLEPARLDFRRKLLLLDAAHRVRREELQLHRARAAGDGQELRVLGVLAVRHPDLRRQGEHREPVLQQRAAHRWASSATGTSWPSTRSAG